MGFFPPLYCSLSDIVRESKETWKKANLLIVMAHTHTKENILQQTGVHYLQVLYQSVVLSINCDSVSSCDQCHRADSLHF